MNIHEAMTKNADEITTNMMREVARISDENPHLSLTYIMEHVAAFYGEKFAETHNKNK